MRHAFDLLDFPPNGNTRRGKSYGANRLRQCSLDDVGVVLNGLYGEVIAGTCLDRLNQRRPTRVLLFLLLLLPEAAEAVWVAGSGSGTGRRSRRIECPIYEMR